jgi:L-asparaginase
MGVQRGYSLSREAGAAVGDRGHHRVVEASLSEIGDGADLVAKMGAIGARGLAPVKARAALMVALGSGGVDAVREWFRRV